MRLVSGLLDRILLLAAVFAAGLLPSFLQQYRQRLQGRLDQLLSDLAPWQLIAERYHGGSLEALIAHHRVSGDPTFVDEAVAIEAMQSQLASLRDAVAAMQGDLLSQLWGWLQHLDRADIEATWALYQPQFPLDPQGLVFALLLGGGIWLLSVGTASGCAHALRRRRQRRRRSAT